ncbi:MAG: hypothetical protein ACK4Q5_14695 [Saprospiraceae bacterium]
MLTLRDFYSGQAIEGSQMFVLEKPTLSLWVSYDTMFAVGTDSNGALRCRFRHDTSYLLGYECVVKNDASYPDLLNFNLRKGCEWAYDVRLKPFSKLRLTIENPTAQALPLDYFEVFYTPPSDENGPFFTQSKYYLDGQNLSDTLAPGAARTFTVKSLPEETLLARIRYGSNKRLERSFPTNRDSLNSLKIRLE